MNIEDLVFAEYKFKQIGENYTNDKPDAYDQLLEFVPNSGEGNTYYEQMSTAINKLIWERYNNGGTCSLYPDGDDTLTSYWCGPLMPHCNDMSSYRDWLIEHSPQTIKQTVLELALSSTEDDYDDKLSTLSEKFVNVINKPNIDLKTNTVGSIYNDCKYCIETVNSNAYDYDEEEDEMEASYLEAVEELEYELDCALEDYQNQLNAIIAEQKQEKKQNMKM